MYCIFVNGPNGSLTNNFICRIMVEACYRKPIYNHIASRAFVHSAVIIHN